MRAYEKITPAWAFKTAPPGEMQNCLFNGITAHFGSVLAFCWLTELNHFNPLFTFFGFIGVSIATLFQMLCAEKLSPSVGLTSPYREDVIKGLSLVFLKGIGIGTCVVAFSWWICHQFLRNTTSSGWFAIFLTVAMADLFYYFIHRFLNHGFTTQKIVKWFRKNHAEHHNVKALDFLRGNHSSLLDTAVCSFQIPTGIIGSLLGLDLIHVLVAYGLLLLLQSTHHVNSTFNIGILRFIFVDNHNHKLHHCPRGYLVNFGAIFSIWDRMFGTCYENWNLSANYLEKNHMPLPIQRKKNSELCVSAEIPPEQKGSVFFGCLMHFGPGLMILVAAAFALESPLLLLVIFFMASFLAAQIILWAEKKWPCVELSRASFKDNIKGMSHIFFNAIIVGTAVVAGGWWVLHKIFISPIQTPAFISIILAVLLSDLFYYGLHRYLNHGKRTNRITRWFRKNHTQHHSVTSLDFMRGSVSSFFDTAITGFQIPVLLASALLGMNLTATLIAYSLLLILEGVHHVNHNFNIGFLRFIFIDNHAHKMHHCLGGHSVNHGVIFSLWDRLFGTYYENRNLSPSFMQKHKIPLPISR